MGTIDAYYKASLEVLAPQPELDLYDPDWPIRTYQPQLPADQPGQTVKSRTYLTPSIFGSAGSEPEAVALQQRAIHIKNSNPLLPLRRHQLAWPDTLMTAVVINQPSRVSLMPRSPSKISSGFSLV